ncbi:hypothetical protein [Brevibacillus laterosporus]|uniref:hypothetical protein n=1 Tax=Brevibacillus laterosporus TaxID=1465 RepID=UPI002650509A|nr:hypothetical protein [Brevibacillus laterosporus]MDN9011891.1 hypothetical protein [Brevibacillus laterosporus]MDO0942987.1 hypothetical protein [Brevibacillus laterosporus]
MKRKGSRRKMIGMLHVTCLMAMLIPTSGWAQADMIKPALPFPNNTGKSGERTEIRPLKQQNPQKAWPKEWRERIEHLINSYEPWSQYKIVKGTFRREEGWEYWDVQLAKGTDEKLSLTINGKNGRLLRALSISEKNQPVPPLTNEWEAAKQAQVFLESLLGREASEYQIASLLPYELSISQATAEQNNMLQGTRVITYQRMNAKSSPAVDDVIRIGIDGCGKIKSFVRVEKV